MAILHKPQRCAMCKRVIRPNVPMVDLKKGGFAHEDCADKPNPKKPKPKKAAPAKKAVAKKAPKKKAAPKKAVKKAAKKATKKKK